MVGLIFKTSVSLVLSYQRVIPSSNILSDESGVVTRFIGDNRGNISNLLVAGIHIEMIPIS